MKDRRCMGSKSISRLSIGALVAAVLAPCFLLPGNASAAEEVRINDKAGDLLGAMTVEPHGLASVSVTVDQSSSAKSAELVLTGGSDGFAVSRAVVKEGEGVFTEVSAGSYRLFATPADVKIVSVRVSPASNERKVSNVSNNTAVLSAGAIAAAAAGTAGLVIGGSAIAGSDGGASSLSGGGVDGGQMPDSAGTTASGSNGGSTITATSAASTRGRDDSRISVAPPVGTISPAPSGANTVVNDLPQQTTGSSGPEGDSEEGPTDPTPTPPPPSNPPPLSNS
jgi:hypothetical protein